MTDHAAVIAALEEGRTPTGWDPDNSDRIADALPPTTTVCVVYWDIYEHHAFGPWRHRGTAAHVIEWRHVACWSDGVATLRERGPTERTPWAGNPGRILGRGRLPGPTPQPESAYLAVESRLVAAHGLTLDQVIVLDTP